MTRILSFFLLCSVLCWSCSSSNDEPDDSTVTGELEAWFTLPSTLEVSPGSEVALSIVNGKTAVLSDVLLLQTTSGDYLTAKFTRSESQTVYVSMPNDITDGSYRASLKRDTRKKELGTVNVKVVDKLDFTPASTSTVYGRVMAGDTPVSGVVVSDGYEVTTTNAKGIYELASEKKYGYVFISIPSGYEAQSNGILPVFYQNVTADSNTLERADFTLTKVSNQTQYDLLVLGDMHLADRTSDLSQFKALGRDLSNYVANNSSRKVYVLTLGDMSWDYYWYTRKYGLQEYLNTMTSTLDGTKLQVFHTMGNHDNDMYTNSDFDAEKPYRSVLGPTYYSFNIGGVHYVVLDNIDCSNYDGTDSRNYKKNITANQLAWLNKDLSYVPSTTPIVVSMHAQVYYPQSDGNFKLDGSDYGTSKQQLFDILSGRKVHFVTGHTHLSFNVTPSDAITNGNNFYEHNGGSICGSWWWSGYLTSGVSIGCDGAPTGYTIFNVNGTDLKWVFKGLEEESAYQFRAYDLNNVKFSMADVPNMPSTVSTSVKNEYLKYCNVYTGDQKNEVLINVWNWSNDWSINVTTESGQKLDVVSEWSYDPLHIAALSVKRFNNSSLSSTPSFITVKFNHFFKVTAPDATTNLKITVSDNQGNTWTQLMERPKAFSDTSLK
jgi:hypothetical protein